MSTDTYCGNCGEPIYNEDSSNRQPCPKCGATKRTYHLTADISVTVSVEADATYRSYAQSFLDTASAWIGGNVRELYSMAVVICHVACEIATDRALEAAFGQLGNKALEVAVRKRIRSNRMGRREVHRLYNALTGRNIENESFWSKYKESIDRRDSIAHEGALVSREEAKETHAAATQLVRYLGP